MTATKPELRVVDNKDEHRYEIWLGDRRVGLALYHAAPGKITFLHTEVDRELRGRGAGSQLAAAALDDARARGLQVTAACSFVARYIQRHPEYAEVGDKAQGRSAP